MGREQKGSRQAKGQLWTRLVERGSVLVSSQTRDSPRPRHPLELPHEERGESEIAVQEHNIVKAG